MAKSPLFWPLLAGAIILAILVGILAFDPDLQDGETYTGSGGDFSLNSVDGPVALANFRGKYVILYFGYTYCPDICPTSLGALSQAMNQLTDQERAQVQGLFISVDPERDTLEKIQTYATYFHPSFKGISGSTEELDRVADQYGVYYRKVPVEGSAMGYAVDHSSTLFLINRDGVLQDRIQHSGSPQAILSQIRALMESEG